MTEGPGLHYEVHGERGPFVLLVHGMLSSRAQWLANLPALTVDYRPVVVELLGHGRSLTPDDTSAYEPASYVREFEAVRRALGVERWFIIGQSLGAALTLRYALDCPEVVIAQVFTNSMSALADADWATRVRPVMEAQAKQLEEGGREALEAHPLNPSNSRRLAPGVREALAMDYALHDPRGIAFTGMYTVPNSSVRDRVTQNSVPALLVAGDREERFHDQRLFAEETMPLLEVMRLEAGHAVNAEAAEEFNEAVKAFFDKHESALGR